jgi:hypothetical protein
MLQTQLRELSLAVWGRLPEALWLRLLDSLPLLEKLEVGRPVVVWQPCGGWCRHVSWCSAWQHSGCAVLSSLLPVTHCQSCWLQCGYSGNAVEPAV